MSCRPTIVPKAEGLDIPALKEKYRQEREKRIRTEGQNQYIEPLGNFSSAYEDDPHMPLIPRIAIDEDMDVVILGGGWAGILAGVELRKAGLRNFCTVDLAGDFGGVWYWNRYPGIQCDNDAYCYLPLLEEMGFMPSKKFSDGAEIFAYCKSIADRFDLYERTLFHTLVKGMRWDESIHRWRVETNRGDAIRARFVIMANGLLNMPKLPGIPGIHEFKGAMFHTSRWNYEYTGGSHANPILDKLSEKRVAIVGTGATAIQAIPYLGRFSKQLYVLQRTPSSVDARNNPLTDAEWVKALQPGWQQHRQDNFHRLALEGQMRPGEQDLVCDFWTEITRNMYSELAAEGWPKLSPEELMKRREIMDFRVMERMRRRIDALIEDEAVAEILKPWYRFPCKRPLSNNDYFPTFNHSNVRLIDVSPTRGVEALTEKGFVADGVEYEIDCLIFASGFEVTSDLDRRWGIDAIEGRDGLSIYDYWADGYKTLHGVISHGFPNLSFIGLYQGGLNASIPETFRQQAHHIAYIIKNTLDRGAFSVEPGLAAQDDWARHIRETGIDVSELQTQCTPSYLNNEGEVHEENNNEKKYRWYLGETYGPGWHAFQKILHDWRTSDELPGMILR